MSVSRISDPVTASPSHSPLPQRAQRTLRKSLCDLCGKKLFISKSDHRVDFRSTSCRDVASNSRHCCKQRGDCSKCSGVVCAHSIEQTRHQSSQCECSGQPDYDADCGHYHSLSDYEFEHVPFLRAESHTYSYLVRTLSNRIGENTVDSDRCKAERNCRKQSNQDENEPLRSNRIRHQPFHRHNVRYGEALVQPV